MAGIALFAHAADKKNSAAPPRAPSKLIKFSGSKTKNRHSQVPKRRTLGWFCLVCFAEQAKTRQAKTRGTGAPNATCENWPSFVRHQSGVTNLEVLISKL